MVAPLWEQQMIANYSLGRLVLIFVTVLGIAFRFYNLDQKVYWHDEVINSSRLSGYSLEEIAQELPKDTVFPASELLKYQFPNVDRSPADTVQLLASAEPQNPPLYYLLGWAWFTVSSHSAAAARTLSAVISLFSLPLMYWLGSSLFREPRVGLTAMALMAVSPFHVLYAQEARPFSLWTVTVLASCCLLLNATRQQTWRSWLLYTMSLVVGLYTFPFTLFVIASHGLYLCLLRPFQIGRSLVFYLASAAASLLLFSPWIFFIVKNADQMDSWRAKSATLTSLVKTWAGNLTRLFFDINLTADSSLSQLLLPVLACLLFIAVSLVFLAKAPLTQAKLFVFSLILVTAAALILPDLALGGRRSTVSRYFIPTYIGIQLAAAYFIAQQTSRKTKLGGLTLAAVIAAGLGSCLVSAQADVWWNKPLSLDTPAIVARINQADSPVILSDRISFDLLEFSHRLEPEAQVQLLSVAPTLPASPAVLADLSQQEPSVEMMLIGPSAVLQETLTDAGYEITPVEGDFGRKLFQVTGATGR